MEYRHNNERLKDASDEMLVKRYQNTKGLERVRREILDEIMRRFRSHIEHVKIEFFSYIFKQKTAYERQDLTQISCLVCHQLIQDYQPKKGVKFSTYLIGYFRKRFIDEFKRSPISAFHGPKNTSRKVAFYERVGIDELPEVVSGESPEDVSKADVETALARGLRRGTLNPLKVKVLILRSFPSLLKSDQRNSVVHFSEAERNAIGKQLSITQRKRKGKRMKGEDSFLSLTEIAKVYRLKVARINFLHKQAIAALRTLMTEGEK